jgi:hypothetical protein
LTLTEGLSPSLAPGASDIFTLRVNATTLGPWSGDISIANNDSDENPFSFRLIAMVIAPVEITV